MYMADRFAVCFYRGDELGKPSQKLEIQEAPGKIISSILVIDIGN